MKRLGVLILVLVVLVGLSATGYAGDVSLERARAVAQNWLQHCITAYHHWEGSATPTIMAEEIIRYGGEIVGYNFLIYPVGNVVVPSRDELPPVKLYSDTSTLIVAENSEVGRWIAEELYKIKNALEFHADELRGIDFSQTQNGKLWTLFETDTNAFAREYAMANAGRESVSLGPLLATTWGQGQPFNNFCPLGASSSRTAVGCVATAASQIMRYWQWPSSGTGSHSYTWDGDQSCAGQSTAGQTLTATFSDSYDWANMLTSYSGGYSSPQADAAAELCYEVGVAFEMDYGACASGANTMYGTTVFPTYFKYKSATIQAAYRTSYASDHDWMLVFKGEVAAGRPSQLRLRDPSAGGHSVVVDGYRDSPSEQVHINLGWNGSYDAWYVTNNIVTGSYNWSDVNYQGAVIGIEPDLTGIYSAQVTSLWPVSNAVPGATVDLWAQVRNTSSQAFPANTKVWFYVTGPNWIGSHWVGASLANGLAAGGEQWYSCMWQIPNNAAPGAYSYWAQVFIDTDPISDWSSAQHFDITVVSVPGQATLVSPTGSICSNTPTYTWNTVPGATYYYLWVNNSSGTAVHQQWYEASAVVTGATASVTPAVTLPGGSYTWWIQTWNSLGYGAWSPGMNFTLPTGPPGMATLVSPAGATSSGLPTYTWNAVCGATYYYLWVNGPSGNVIKEWYKASDVTTGSTCAVAPAVTLGVGAHMWWIQTWNPTSYGPWSSGMGFTVGAGGFNSQFDTDAAGWESHSGTWWVQEGGWYTTQGIPSNGVSASHVSDFSNVDYQVKLWRNGSQSSSNRIMIRGTPLPLFGTNSWYKAYAFQYTANGSYSVWKYDNGITTPIQNWASSSYINQGGAWNVLRVVANGANLSFYINGSLVWSGTDSSFSSGRAGIGMYSDGTSGDQLWVDWAVLTEGAGTVYDVVSPEQQALNQEASKNRYQNPNSH